MAASIVQTAINGQNSGSSITATFGATPTPENILVWIVSRYSARSTAPSNGGTYPFTQRFLSPSGQGNAAVDVYTRPVAAGDPTSWGMDELFGTDSMTACIVEVAGTDGDPSTWTMPTVGVSSSPVSQSVTGTAGQLLIVGVALNGGSTFGGLTTITPSGYTEDRHFIPAGDSLSVGHTTATGAAQSIGASWDGSNGDCVQVVIAVTSAPVPSRWHVGVIGMN